MSEAEAHSEFGVKKKKKPSAKASAAAEAVPAGASADSGAVAAVAPAAVGVAPAAAVSHPEFGAKKGKSSKSSAAASVAVPEVASAVPPPAPPAAAQPELSPSPSDEPSSASTSSSKRKGVSFHPELPEESSSSSKAKADGGDEAEAEARSAALHMPELEAHIPRCRFYKNDFPEPDEFVVVKVQSIEEMGAYVTLLEYDNVQGMILLSELSRRRIRSIHKLLRVGRKEIVMVIRCDKGQSCIDLSKRRVTPADRVKCEERYKKACLVQSILGYISTTLKVPVEDLAERISFPLYRKYGHAYDAFQLAESKADEVFAGLTISDEERSLLLKKIRHSMTPQPLNIRADIDVTCFEYEGIEAIKTALRAGLALSTDKNKVSIRILASPTYVLMTTTLDSAEGIALLERVITAIQLEIKKHKGAVAIRTKPTVTSHQDVFAEGDDDEDVEEAEIDAADI